MSTITTAIKAQDTIKPVIQSMNKVLTNVISNFEAIQNSTAHLNMVVDTGGSVEELENKIYTSAQKSKAHYIDVANTIVKLNMNAGNVFKNNDETIKFAELLNKQFVISGTEQSEIASASLQLTQALASGTLKGEQLNTIFETVPTIIQSIADYMNVDIGKIKELASEGKISADIIKNAMFLSADSIDQRFNNMPITWTQIFTNIKNTVLKMLQPIFKKINEIVNSQQFQEIMSRIIDAILIVIQIATPLLNIIINICSFIIDNWSWIEPIIIGIVGAFVALNLIMLIYNITMGISSFIIGIVTAAKKLHEKATIAETAAQVGLNSAMLACPAVWIALIIIILIVVLTYLWFTNDKVAKFMLQAWDSLIINVMILKLAIQLAFYGIVLIALKLWQNIIKVVIGIMANFFAFQLAGEALKFGFLGICEGIANSFIDMYNIIAKILNKLGLDLEEKSHVNFTASVIDETSKLLTKQAKQMAEARGYLDEVQSEINNVEKNILDSTYKGFKDIQNKAKQNSETIDDRVAHRNDWIKGAKDTFTNVLGTPINLPGINDITSNTGNTAGNTGKISDTLDATEEDLQYLRDIAERETINRFTTAEIKVDFTSHNNINSEMDVDGIVNSLGEKLEERLEVVAEGVYI